MSVPYDVFTDAFLSKITEYDFVNMRDFERNGLIDGYMKRAIASFRKICKYDLSTTGDDIIREFDVDIPDEDLDEIADIVSEGMLVQWMKPYTYKQESLESVLTLPPILPQRCSCVSATHMQPLEKILRI